EVKGVLERERSNKTVETKLAPGVRRRRRKGKRKVVGQDTEEVSAAATTNGHSASAPSMSPAVRRRKVTSADAPKSAKAPAPERIEAPPKATNGVAAPKAQEQPPAKQQTPAAAADEEQQQQTASASKATSAQDTAAEPPAQVSAAAVAPPEAEAKLATAAMDSPAAEAKAEPAEATPAQAEPVDAAPAAKATPVQAAQEEIAAVEAAPTAQAGPADAVVTTEGAEVQAESTSAEEPKAAVVVVDDDEEAQAEATAPGKREPKPAQNRAEKDKKEPKLQRSKTSKRSPSSAKVLGRIDPEILRQRLRAEGKSFEPPGSSGGGGSPNNRRGGSRRKQETQASGGGGGGGRTSSGFARPSSDNNNSNNNNTSGRGRGRGKHRSRRTVGPAELYDDNARIRRLTKQRKSRKPSKTQITQAAEHKRVIKINEAIVLSDLARQMGVKGNELVKALMGMGEMMTINQAVDVDTATLLAEQFDHTVENVSFDPSNYYDDTADADGDLKPRPPVVTIMGHVDHGKTSLLDAIRSTDVASGEAGGITQHIGAYQVNVPVDGEKRPVTFLDTPGHEAFTALRARGAQVTDIVVLVVAADDGVMPQTVEAINHSRDAEVPIVVAVNKIDKPGAIPDRVKQALTEYALIPEDWGGDTLFVDVSAIQHTNIDVLLENLLLQAEIMELRANPERAGYGIVVESRLDIGLGAVATILVQRGSVSPGDIVVVGEYYGRIRAMYNHRGEDVAKAVPSMAVEITGLSGVPTSGEVFFQVEEEKTAREIVSNVQRKLREAELANRARKPTGIEELTRMIKEGDLKELKVIVKADVQGSIEAVKGSLEKLGNDEVRVKVIHSAVGGITENDVNLAASSPEGAIIVGFNVRPDSRALAAAEERGVDMVLQTIIYEIEDAITSILEGMLQPLTKEVDLGQAEVREVFMVPKIGAVAGCYVTGGKIVRNGQCRVVRQGRIIYTSRIAGLRRFKDDVREVKRDFECGINVENFNDVKVGDVIECFEIQEERATL
ncbi:MAG: translation initiation factor IF-2, partial [Myxococcota bacterium]